MPLPKRKRLDKDTPANYRTISNLNTISKNIEKFVFGRLRRHWTSSPSFNRAQTAYRRHNSSETALLRTTDAAYRAADRSEAALIVAFDISAAFDTVNHFSLLSHLHNSFSVGGNALPWISSYLSERSQTVHVGSASSTPPRCSCGVPQGSILGPILFTVCTSPVADVADSDHVNRQQ